MIDIEYCIEYDIMGEVWVFVNVFYGVQMQCVVENFLILGKGLELMQIVVLVWIKKVVVLVNKEFGIFDGVIVDVIVQVVDQVVFGVYDGEFLVDIYQIGFGIFLNMNMNEVFVIFVMCIFGLVVYFNDYVNVLQLLNDVFFILVYIVVMQVFIDMFILVFDYFVVVFEVKVELWKDVVKFGCMYFMDVMFVIFGQEFGGYVCQICLGIECVQLVFFWVVEVLLGGIVMGIGINMLLGFLQKVIELFVVEIELFIIEVKDYFEVQVNCDGLVEVFGVLCMIVVLLIKINNDLCWMGFGFNMGFGEFYIFDLQFGFLIMLGKVNFVVFEVVFMVCVCVIGNDVIVVWVGVFGFFEFNVVIFVMGIVVFELICLLLNVLCVFVDKIIDGLQVNVECVVVFVGMSLLIVMLLNKFIGYEVVVKIVKYVVVKGIMVCDVVIDLGYVECGDLMLEQLDEKFDLLFMMYLG